MPLLAAVSKCLSTPFVRWRLNSATRTKCEKHVILVFDAGHTHKEQAHIDVGEFTSKSVMFHQFYYSSGKLGQ